MAKKSYQTPKVIFGITPGGDEDDPVTGSGQTPLNLPSASFSAWKMAVQNANLDMGLEYSDYVRWMTENGYEAFIQPDDSELR